MTPKRLLTLLALICALALAGCGNETPAEPAPADAAASTVSFVSGMGCDDPNCTDPSHHHDCPADCGDYEHHHHCGLDCDDPAHNHNCGEHHGAAASTVSFVSGMGCDDPNCTDSSHHHDCPADCGDYEHHHHCGLDCDDPAHNHNCGEHHGGHHGSKTR